MHTRELATAMRHLSELEPVCAKRILFIWRYTVMQLRPVAPRSVQPPAWKCQPRLGRRTVLKFIGMVGTRHLPVAGGPAAPLS
jgi:hypothetical protein